MSTSAASEAAAAGAPAPSAPAGVTDPAGAEAPDPALRKIVLERRNGVVLGVSAGFGLAGASGHPNSAKLLDNPAYFSSTPMLPGYAMSFFLLGAFTDYVSFGPMVNIATFENEQWKSTGYALGFRLETFPLLRLFPAMADTSLYSQFGFGSTEARAKGNYPTADGSRSFLGVGVHHEFRVGKMLGGHAAIGPYVEYDATFAQSAERHFLSFGARVAWYGGRVTEDKN